MYTHYTDGVQTLNRIWRFYFLTDKNDTRFSIWYNPENPRKTWNWRVDCTLRREIETRELHDYVMTTYIDIDAQLEREFHADAALILFFCIGDRHCT